ncbi:quaternary amine ABC transporter ATP-binding protein [Victivallis vadensis]|uniref:Glycine betaine/L-proline ABC transporter ATP-binding protein n=1 Tax=Victivallis vadensis TaxID=172901 RepID=A0A2U1AV89_9BACT|nr:glycine betaine/L-proline ABC transporter ATP-binding protein [Victivallis vadensis]NMD85769.1 glycine betaine/L-proline ABC transporter ATP-binding protein [Victivallis vadensis]PVY40313.1 glycine betaine/proline transport system ATP-binding protein [Victivallis vadensis]PWM77065.1 MAG: glycine/betaine ABC transporter ATP-binding protein [Lentisphaerota bacterium]
MTDQTIQTEELVRVEGLTKVFGRHHKRAAELFRAGKTREEVYKATQCSIGVHNVSFTIRRGELFVVMGLSGSGKSTLIRTINRLIEPSDGKIFIDGTEVTALNKKQLRELRRRRIGMVFQQFALYPHLTVLDNAAYALKIAGVPREARRARAREVLALVGLADYAEHFPDQLSGGMRQRVGIARALAADPEIIIMDEALSALDPLIRREMQNEIRALQKKLGKTVIFITHDLDEAIRLADRVLIMKDGEIAQLGTMEEILSRPANAYVEKFVNAADKTKVITAGSIMKPVYDYLRLGDGPQTMLHKIRESGLSSLFATNDQGVIYGLVWARKVREHMNEPNVTAQSMMDTNIKTVNRSAPLKEVVMQMGESTAPIAVVDDERRFLGVITSGALLASLASYNGTTGEIK